MKINHFIHTDDVEVIYTFKKKFRITCEDTGMEIDPSKCSTVATQGASW